MFADLQYQLHKLEKENDRALKIQSDLVKKYRAFVTALTGLQIKMKDDDLVQVESIFDPGNYFIFKVSCYTVKEVQLESGSKLLRVLLTFSKLRIIFFEDFIFVVARRVLTKYAIINKTCQR